jgi:GTP-binding protein HflX
LSARSGAGVGELLRVMDEQLAPRRIWQTLKLPPEAGDIRACLFRKGLVREETVDAAGNWIIDVMLAPDDLRKFCRDNDLDVNMVRYGI